MQLSSRDTRNTGILDRWTGRYWRKRSCGITRAKFTWRRRTAAGTGACPTCTIHLFYLYRHLPRHAPVQPARYTCLTYTLTGTLSGTYLSNLQDTPVLPVHSHALSQARTCHNCNYTPVHLYTPWHSLRHAPVPPVWGHRGRGGGGDVTVGHGRVAAVRHHRYHYDRYTYDAIHLHIYRGADGAMAHTKCGPTALSSHEFFSQ